MSRAVRIFAIGLDLEAICRMDIVNGKYEYVGVVSTTFLAKLRVYVF